MIPKASWRFAWALLGASVAISGPVGIRSALAGDEDDEDEDDGDEDDEGDADEEEDSGAEADQPPVTAGGLYSLHTYPAREVFRPMTISEKMLEVRAGLGFDVSAKQAFESVGAAIGARYGLRDHFELQLNFDSAYNFKAFAFTVGMEAALAYDLVDFRTGFRMFQPAAVDPGTGDIVSGDFDAAIDVGFPFRYKVMPQVAVTALDTLFSVNFDSKPDLAPSVGIVLNPMDPLALLIDAQVLVPEFDTEVEKFQVPASATVQFSPSHRIDIAGKFTFLNLNAAEGVQFYDRRFLTFYGQLRF
jgi:hypothetical protein